MTIKKVIEVLAESDESWEAAAERAVREVSETVRNVRSIYVDNFSATVKDGRMSTFRINAKVTFEVDETRP